MNHDCIPLARVDREPDMKEALSWYPRMNNQYAPLGWKNCLFEFLVLWNGDIVAPTTVGWKQGLEKYHDADAQVGFTWMVGKQGECGGDQHHDNSPVTQEYLAGWKPTIITKRFVQGIEITETVFAHVPGKQELVNGDEPMYLWVDFALEKVIELLVPENEVTLNVQLSAHRLVNGMEAGHNSYNTCPATPYAHTVDLLKNCLLQADGKVRLMVGNEGTNHLQWQQSEAADGKNSFLAVRIPLVNGKGKLRLLIPILPVAKSVIESEMAFGYNAALTETMEYWEEETSKGIKLQIPEKIVEHTFRTFPWRALIIAERNPVFHEYSINNGAFSYDMLWPTPGCMSNVWGLDYFGYHEDAARYLEIYRHDQGNTQPPGEYFIPHPGFLSTPEKFKVIRWLNEHGAIMWAIGEHYLLTRDREFLDRWLPSLLQACEWIYVQRRNEDHPGIPGIMPPGVATDDCIPGQFIWNDGWLYKGLKTVAKVLLEVNHPEAQKWEREAEDYKQRFNEIFQETCSNMPTWKAEDGTEYSFIPTDITGKLWGNNRHAFYLDTGPLFLAFAGIVDIGSPIFDAVLKWYREGPQVKYWRFDGCCWQVPVLHHEMSSCEPCYSWNMDINFLRDDRPHFLEGLYAQLAGARNTDLFSDIETRNGMFATNFSTPPTFHHFRNGLVYENGNMLELFRMLPAAWLKPGDVLDVQDIPTYFGPMGLRLQRNDAGNEISMTIQLPIRNKPERIILTVPSFLTVQRILVDGTEGIVEGGTVDLTGKTGEVNLQMTTTV